MKFIGALAMAGAATAAPLAARAINDVDILQFALTLEHLENAFYKGALAKFSQKDFANAGFDDFYYRNLQFIGADEQDHVALLSGGLTAAGAKPVKPCTYNFPYTTVKGFLGLSAALEDVGTSAYLGAAPAVASKAYLTIAGAILAVEAKHTSLQRFVLGRIAPENPYQTPLGPNEVYTLAAAFITGCPKDNYALPFTAFPTLTAEIGNLPQVGQDHTTEFSTKATNVPAEVYLTFLSGLKVTSVRAQKTKNGRYSANVPYTVEGQSYVVLTKTAAANDTLVESSVISGPAILEVCSNLDYNNGNKKA